MEEEQPLRPGGALHVSSSPLAAPEHTGWRRAWVGGVLCVATLLLVLLAVGFAARPCLLASAPWCQPDAGSGASAAVPAAVAPPLPPVAPVPTNAASADAAGGEPATARASTPAAAQHPALPPPLAVLLPPRRPTAPSRAPAAASVPATGDDPLAMLGGRAHDWDWSRAGYRGASWHTLLCCDRQAGRRTCDSSKSMAAHQRPPPPSLLHRRRRHCAPEQGV